MRNWRLLVTLATLVLTCQFTGGAYTLTFDDVPAGSQWAYGQTLGINNGFVVEDHSGSAMAPPRSGTNVLSLTSGSARITLQTPPIDTSGRGIPYDAYYFGAYFSTGLGATVKMTIQKQDGEGVATINELAIGSRDEAWTNMLVEYYSPAGDIHMIRFQVIDWPVPVYPTFVLCLDDLTIIPVPEPSSLAAVACGVAGIVGVALRRRGE